MEQIRTAATEAELHRQALAEAVRGRDRAVAELWWMRPIGVTWREFLAELNGVLPTECHISLGAARLAERKFRPGGLS